MLRQRKKENKCEQNREPIQPDTKEVSNIITEEQTNDKKPDEKLDPGFIQRYNTTQFDSLVISCGGVNIIKIIGMLQKFHEDKKLDDILYYVGCSAGSIATLLLLINITPRDMLNRLLKIDYKTLFHNINLQTILSGKCILPNEILMKHIEDIIQDKLGFIPTMIELFELTKKKWTVATFNYTDYHIEYIDYKTHPHVLCSHVAAASSAIPILFTPVQINNKNYIDGGVLDTFPIKQHLNTHEHSKVLGIIIGDDFNSDEFRHKRETANTIQLLIDVLYINKRKRENKYMQYNSKDNICIFKQNCEPASGVNFSMDETDKLRGFLESYNFMKKMLNTSETVKSN
jgi:predicted acylesterase/phospholipase RssA